MFVGHRRSGLGLTSRQPRRQVEYLLIVYFWSTVDPRLHTDALPGAAPLTLRRTTGASR
jgi:hypothetical protein